jgi:hypothetical protein
MISLLLNISAFSIFFDVKDIQSDLYEVRIHKSGRSGINNLGSMRR